LLKDAVAKAIWVKKACELERTMRIKNAYPWWNCFLDR